MSGIKPYKGIKLSGTPPTTTQDKINTHNFKVLAKNVKTISETYVSSGDTIQIIEGDKIFNNLYVTGISANNVLTVDTCGRIIDSGISITDLITGGGGADITLVAGTNISIVESPANTYTISVSGEISSNLADLNDVNIVIPVDGQVLTYDSGIGKWVNSSISFSFNGSLDLNTTDQVYTINHSYTETPIPVVSLVIPTSGDDLYITGISNITNTSFKVSLSSVPAISGYKLNYILATDSTPYSSTSQVADISAYLQNQINTKVDNIIGGPGLSVIEFPANTFLISITGDFGDSQLRGEIAAITGDLDARLDIVESTYITEAEVAGISGYLNSRINGITGDNTVVIGGSGIHVIQSPTQVFTVSVSGDYITRTEVSNISAGLNSRLLVVESTYITEAEVAGISGYLQTQITNITAGVSNVNIIAGSGIQVIESPTDTFTISVTGDFGDSQLRGEIAAITGDFDNRITAIENTYITEAEVSGISGYLQNQINTVPLSAYTLRTETASVSAYLNNRINGITGENTIVIGGSGIQVIQSPTQVFTISVSGNYATTSQVTAASANAYIQSITYTNTQNYITKTEVSNISGYLQGQINNITGGGSTNLDGLTDVVITNPTSGQILYFNGSQWVNKNENLYGGGWAYCSLAILDTQSTGLTAGGPIRFTTIQGDHTLSNYRFKVLGGQKAKLTGSARFTLSSGSSCDLRWYDYTNSQYIGINSVHFAATYTGNQTSTNPAVALVSPAVDTEYELRISYTGASITLMETAYATIESTDANVILRSEVEDISAYLNTRIDEMSGGFTSLAGGDLSGSYPNPTVIHLTQSSKTLTYNGLDQLDTYTDGYGTKSFSYNGNGQLISVTGTGVYQSKTLTYDIMGKLIGINIT